MGKDGYFLQLQVQARIDMAELLWAEYYVDTELFDRAICTGPMGLDGIQPATADERSRIRRNASQEHARVCVEVERYGITPDESWQARRKIGKMSFEERRAFLCKARKS